MAAFDSWLDSANPADLFALARSLREGRIRDLSSRSAVQLGGFSDGAAVFLAGLAEAPISGVVWMLERLGRERQEASNRYARTASLVWSGASEDHEPLRDTRTVLDELFQRAERHVLLSTYVFYNGRAVLAKLAERARSLPQLQVDLYVNLSSDTGQAQDEAAEIAAYLRTFARDHWPAGQPLPVLYFAPASRFTGTDRAAVHAKCVVVDERWAFVTSANFTAAAQDRNIELGVLLDQPTLATSLTQRFRALRETGWMKRMA